MYVFCVNGSQCVLKENQHKALNMVPCNGLYYFVLSVAIFVVNECVCQRGCPCIIKVIIVWVCYLGEKADSRFCHYPGGPERYVGW